MKKNCHVETRERVYNLVGKILYMPPKDKTIVRLFDDISDLICQVADKAEFLRNVYPNEQYRNHCSAIVSNMLTVVEELNTNFALYEKLKKLLDSNVLDETDSLVAKSFIRDFESSGINLSGDFKKLYINYQKKIESSGNELCNMSQICIKPHRLIHKRKKYPIKMVEDNLYSKNPNIREKAYNMLYHVDMNNYHTENLKKLLKYRSKLANVTNYTNYFNRTLEHSILKTRESVHQFLSTINENLKPNLKKLFENMSHNCNIDKIKVSDIMYINYKLSNKYMNHKSNKSFQNCINSLHDLYNKLFGISFNLIKDSENYPDIYYLQINDANSYLGTIYLDLFSRPGKIYQDCHFTIRGGRKINEYLYQSPIVALCLNVNPNHANPLNVDFDFLQQKNLFHEFGHAIHSILGRTKYQQVTGTRCSTDFAEIPSTFMENYVEYPQNNQPSVDEKNFKLFIWPIRFPHIYQYGSKYFSYILAKSIACIIKQSTSMDINSREFGQHFRDKFLIYGGERDPVILIEDLINKPLTVEMLSDALLQDFV
ncbi:hypothetical protein A3Q56_01872 [Intoshia linei]|uniref:Peptidase M3A/M3B catalytic domain-containing protein n=1 Tax=Intoshia linei TaxID=1819745 RepID=A0A177BA80_9BILA|nr:hypothetical protein A3Q56_01872 [Intoshia linei]